MEIVLQFLLLCGGFVLLVKGADWFVEGVSGAADRFGIPQLVIGLTVVAMGTSAPEAAVSITAALQGSAGITIGNIVGSNILNILIILGLTAVITRVPVQRSTVRIEIPYMLGVTVVLLVLGLTGGAVARWEGAVLWVLFLAYLGYLLRMALREKRDGPEPHHRLSVPRLAFMTLIGVAGILIGSDLTVDAAKELARVFGMSERFIGLTVVALGTSLPELVTSVTAARRGKADIAIGNIVGSNIFNILFVVGTTALITPVAFQESFRADMAVAVLAAVVLLVCVWRRGALGRGSGVLMLACYGGYFLYLLR